MTQVLINNSKKDLIEDVKTLCGPNIDSDQDQEQDLDHDCN